VAEGTSANFTVGATLGDGSSVDPAVIWAATGGTIDGSGKFTAGEVPGNYSVTATTANGVADTAAVMVTTSLPAVADLSLTPSSASLPVGGSKQFVALGKSSDGTTIAVTPKYLATGGTIAADGIYHAGVTPGTFQVIATDTVTNLADTSAVVIEPPPTLEAVVLSPATASLTVGATQQFAAFGRMSSGDSVAVPVTFTATGGSITGAGLFTAGQSGGTFRVIAAASTMADTSTVTITAPAPAPTLQAVVLTPATASLSVGATQQFAAFGRMSSGDSVAVPVTFTATGGSITAAGLYTAGQSGGTFRVIATASTMADTSTVTITAPAPLPPPSNAVTIAPGENWQSKVNAYPAGTVFRILAGRHLNASVLTNKNGNQFIGDAGAIMDGQGTTTFAFSGAASDLVVKNLEIIRYTGGGRLGAINAYDGVRWTLDHLNVHDNPYMGINLRGNFTVLGGTYHHNGQYGLSVYQGQGGVIDGAELAYNNLAGAFPPLWDAGGIKVTYSNGVTIRNTNAHHNNGPGLWYDINNSNSLLENNNSHDNNHAGIFYEISYNGIIRGNTATGNGVADPSHTGAGILVSASADVEVYDNTVSGNSQGIVALQENRGNGPNGQPYRVQNLNVHNNVVTQSVGRKSGLLNFISATDGAAMMSGRNNRFNLNQYTITGNATPFYASYGSGSISKTQWQGYGQDVNSTFVGP
jgi:parallel beta-helix repeat protein